MKIKIMLKFPYRKMVVIMNKLKLKNKIVILKIKNNQYYLNINFFNKSYNFF